MLAKTCDEAPWRTSLQYARSDVQFDRSVTLINSIVFSPRPFSLPTRALDAFQRDFIGDFVGGSLRRTNAYSPRDDRSRANCGGKVGRTAWRWTGEKAGDSFSGGAKGSKPTALVGLFKGNNRRRWIGRFCIYFCSRDWLTVLPGINRAIDVLKSGTYCAILRALRVKRPRRQRVYL